MEVFTLSSHAKPQALKYGLRVIDISPAGGTCFAPNSVHLDALRNNQMSPALFADRYYADMRERFNSNPKPWMDTLHSQQTIGFVCDCAAGGTCHREYLLDIFRKIALYYVLPFVYKGEFGVNRHA